MNSCFSHRSPVRANRLAALFVARFVASITAVVFFTSLLELRMTHACHAAEPWADARLTVRDGLQLWLDAGRAFGADLRPYDGKLAVWYDASGRQRHVRQATADAQPKLLPVGQTSIVRFDGLDDHLRATAQGAHLDGFTLFIVAAPRRNPGAFRALLAVNARDQRDYVSGVTVDMGPAGSADFAVLNVEGRGFGGARNLRTATGPFGRLQVIEIASAGVNQSVELTIDGRAEGQRPRASPPRDAKPDSPKPAPAMPDAGVLDMDEITIGARYYNNVPGPQHVDGHGPCDLAEVLVYDRRLSAEERATVRQYLAAKFGDIRQSLPADELAGGESLTPVENPPAVQVFVPGFEVRELPIDLTNINNVKCRSDGTLLALGYDGRIWRLSDANGDGWEDRAELFWDNRTGLRAPIGMDVTPENYERGDGMFVVGKTRCVLIVDTDRDGRADREIEVAGGWKESFHSVDGLGVAFDTRDGSLYFGRGTYNFADPLLRDKDGKPQYSLRDESAAVIRVSPDFKTREIIATGIRFPVALRFNRQGDLFATDQEGATWVPNGNPFDELLHIQRGRHYGFPPRHPRDLPDVIDEPSTFDYAPQHQSTCGLNFNEPIRANGPIFGPEAWRGDALVTGYSRGKLYRTQLVKSSAGYVARTQLFAALQMLTVDACVAADGGLVVACHSGGPDWGSGPAGKGKLFKIRYADTDRPQPALVWPSGPREVRVEFDRPVDPQQLRDALSASRLTAGEFVGAGDRYERLRPGYAVVDVQRLAPRWNVPVRSLQLTPDRRSLLLAVDALPGRGSFALTLPGLGRDVRNGDVGDRDSKTGNAKTGSSPTSESQSESRSGETQTQAVAAIAQHAVIDLAFDLTGTEAEWRGANGESLWGGWLPHLDLQVARDMTRGSATHDRLWKLLGTPGQLTLRTKLDLWHMLRPAVQPGSQIDYELPRETVTVNFTATNATMAPITIVDPSRAADASEKRADASDDRQEPGRQLTVQPERHKPVLVEVRMQVAGGQPPALTVSWSTAEDARLRPLPLRRLDVPWSSLETRSNAPSPTMRAPELAGGSWGRGRNVFFSEQAACSKCHAIHGRGGAIGPDLSNLEHRDYASVHRDITNPSYAINPDHSTYAVELKDGRLLSGVVRTAGDRLTVFDQKAGQTQVAREEVERLTPLAVSTMPEGIAKQLGDERFRDLLTFLLTPPPRMPRDYPGPGPAARKWAEIQAVLAGEPTPAERTRKLHIVLVAGPKDHGPGEHDYPAWQKTWSELLSAGEKVEVSTAWEWPDEKQLDSADVLVVYQHGDCPPARAASMDRFLARGGGVVFLHWAIDGRMFGRELAQRTGLAALGGVGFRHGPIKLTFDRTIEHPVTRNFRDLELVDETYWKMFGELPRDRLLASAVEEDRPQPQIWSLERDRGRVFVSIPGHYSWTFDDPLFRILILRAIAWSAREPVDRFNDLVFPGALWQR